MFQLSADARIGIGSAMVSRTTVVRDGEPHVVAASVQLRDEHDTAVVYADLPLSDPAMTLRVLHRQMGRWGFQLGRALGGTPVFAHGDERISYRRFAVVPVEPIAAIWHDTTSFARTVATGITATEATTRLRALVEPALIAATPEQDRDHLTARLDVMFAAGVQDGSYHPDLGAQLMVIDTRTSTAAPTA